MPLIISYLTKITMKMQKWVIHSLFFFFIIILKILICGWMGVRGECGLEQSGRRMSQRLGSGAGKAGDRSGR